FTFMETVECIKTRRSRRLFLKKAIPEKIVNKLIECAVNAPSSQNCQPWHFVLITREESKIRLAKLKGEGNDQHILTAPISIAVCVDTKKSPTRWIEDGVVATQNILLAAHDLGLGAVYVTGFKQTHPEVEKEIRKILSLPPHITPITIIPIGYADPSEKLNKKELLNIKGVVHHDTW
ncbi:nitroreductase family protein, partial [Candidatus Woesearchaeota archaeon]|nr:nitroreductase family protein [Candidatus Woesearchaeota archaeon]